MAKTRILNPEVAALLATLRHGEMIYIADAGSAWNDKSLYPLDPSVKYIDLGVVTGVPTTEDLVRALVEVGDFEGAILPWGMDEENPEFYNMIAECVGKEKIHGMNYAPEYYDMRNRCSAMIQTGDYGMGCNVILIAGYTSNDIDIDILSGKSMYVCTAEEYITMPMKEFKAKYRSEE